MTTLHLSVAIPDDEIDPAQIDAEDEADRMVSIYNEWAAVNGSGAWDLISAEWDQ